MKRLEKINDSIFKNYEKDRIDSLNKILGGDVGGGKKTEKATLRNSNGCSQADKKYDFVTVHIFFNLKELN